MLILELNLWVNWSFIVIKVLAPEGTQVLRDKVTKRLYLDWGNSKVSPPLLFANPFVDSQRPRLGTLPRSGIIVSKYSSEAAVQFVGK